MIRTTVAHGAHGATAAPAPLRLRTAGERPERPAIREEIAADIEEEAGIAVEIIPVPQSDLGTRATAAFAAGDLPDVV